MNEFHCEFTAGPEHIDELGHVNNIVWVEWIQHISIAHWQAVATPEMLDRWIWMVVRHEIDYRGNIGPGERALARTWVPEPPRRARFNRHVEFRNPAGKAIIRSVTSWVLLDRTTQSLTRISDELVSLFDVPAK